ncbi:sigma-70 family RNA polymerase sigma factor [Clostridium sp. D2Q-11]|uniref:Sigma-70 family RNA polymerase sigma factor n=1 Tax=Anaeromonas frigoriresistens TaxID=2683708 RepID=A0A942URL6_9FIRM|nr:sigma-70 family RNA polymerase sigma factor [Anaeromonas frigoriresistens]MBS4537974.1 sigma-70 family RNA polymerase sigma factor [Anaeromonas frigoriresistens]
MNEKEIVEQINKGDIEAFRLLVDKYKDRVFSCAYKFTGDYLEAQDLSQEIFLKIYRNIKSFNNQSKLSTWIYRVSTNMCIDWKRKNQKKLDLIINNFSGNTEISDNILPETDIIQKEDRNGIRSKIESLPNIYKETLILYHFYEMSYKDISKELKISEKTVDTRLYRGRRLLREHLNKYSYGGEIYGL